MEADRRADGLRRADPAALRRLHPRQRPPRRVAAPQSSAPTRPSRPSAPTPSCSSTAWATLLDDLPDAVDADAAVDRCRADPPPRRRRRAAARRRSPSWRSADAAPPRSADARSPARRRRSRADRARRDEGGARRRRAELERRAAEAAARPRPAAVAEGPLRHRGRPGGARRAADHRPRHRRRPRRRGRRAVPGRGHPRPGRRRRAARAGTPSARRSSRGRGRRAALARGVRLHADRRPPARGLRRPALPHAPTGWSSSTTRPPPPTDPAELDRRVEGYRLQGASYAVAVARATGEPVVRVAFLFLTPERRGRARPRRPRPGEGRGRAAHRLRRRGGPRLTFWRTGPASHASPVLQVRVPVLTDGVPEPDLHGHRGLPRPRLGFGYTEAPASTGSELRRRAQRSARRCPARPMRSMRLSSRRRAPARPRRRGPRVPRRPSGAARPARGSGRGGSAKS